MIEMLPLELLIYMTVAMLIGGAIGLERELQQKPVGLRTTMLICVGAAIFTHLSEVIAGSDGDPSRVASQIVTGVGFIGAGAILYHRGSVTGLTTAATIWVVAAIGMMIGTGRIAEALAAAILVLLVLVPLGKVEDWISQSKGSDKSAERQS